MTKVRVEFSVDRELKGTTHTDLIKEAQAIIDELAAHIPDCQFQDIKVLGEDAVSSERQAGQDV